MNLKFTWDTQKAASNLKKHHVSFEFDFDFVSRSHRRR